MKIVNSNEMKNLDKYCIDNFGISQEILMENAARAALGVIKKHCNDLEGENFICICGKGNNGGDGFAVARLLHSNGAVVKIFACGEVNDYIGASNLNYKIAQKLNIEFITFDNLKSEIANSEFVVDALFGVGINRDIEGIYSDIISLINAGRKKVISLDIPSGINSDNGLVMGSAVKADYTISFGFLKYGNLLYPGHKYHGRLYHDTISFPPNLDENLSGNINVPIELPIRETDSHKGDYGKTLFICGSANYYGAPYFSAMSFLNSGGGYSRLATPKSIVPTLASMAPDIVFYPMEETENGSLAYSNKKNLLKLIANMKMLVIGCGISLDPETKKLVKEIIQETNIPVLIDADALTIITEELDIIRNKQTPVILTPHLGEMSRLCKMPINKIKNCPMQIINKFSKEYGCIIVLKGAHTQLSFPNGDIFVNLSGNSSLAVAGTGDLLCGVIAGQYSLGFSIEEAVRMGVYLHGLNGEFISKKYGLDGTSASLLLPHLSTTLSKYRKNLLHYSSFFKKMFDIQR